jgi:hypothetical protein
VHFRAQSSIPLPERLARERNPEGVAETVGEKCVLKRVKSSKKYQKQPLVPLFDHKT